MGNTPSPKGLITKGKHNRTYQGRKWEKRFFKPGQFSAKGKYGAAAEHSKAKLARAQATSGYQEDQGAR